ncbi:MAG: hypothetical protein WC654_00750 [Patescibacteria group bacterium]
MKDSRLSYALSMAALFWIISLISNRVEIIVNDVFHFGVFYAGLIADMAMVLFGFSVGWGLHMRRMSGVSREGEDGNETSQSADL